MVREHLPKKNVFIRALPVGCMQYSGVEGIASWSYICNTHICGRWRRNTITVEPSCHADSLTPNLGYDYNMQRHLKSYDNLVFMTHTNLITM